MESDVIVVGAGPTGLMLAGELRTAGVSVLVVERLAEPTGQSRGLGFTTRATEVFDQRGLLPRFGDVEMSPMGHFGGLPLDFSVLPGADFGARGIQQSRVEQVLGDWAAELGAKFLRGHEIVALAGHDDHVEITVEGPEGRSTLRSAWLVGCDGGQSTVRKLGGFSFEGTASTREMYLADVRGCDLPPRFTGMRVPGGMVMNAPLGPGVDRIIACELGATPGERTEPLEFAEVVDVWKRLTGEDISGGTPEWVSVFGDAARQATEYRRGRVLLAGDAAHIHLPAGGQGLSVGVQDAVNLGWKLAAAVRGWAPDGLLDTYHDERHPVGVRLLMNTSAQGHLYLSGPEVDPVRSVFAELLRFEEVGRHLAGMVSGLDVRYDVGGGDHPLLGRRIPPSELDDGTTTAQALHGGRGVLFDFKGDSHLRSVAARWAGRVDVVTAAGSPFDGTSAVLVRPDGHVAWATPGHVDELGDVLGRWFGTPEVST
ncbi:FAD-binding protein [Lentzea tibetensis]|uniref:FAD-binding protein n=1 Tax=Lentzea tibetensis TaxID=2591470 RepID=A0A563ES48_9PSEU|nr:FAD-dependent monooxygenase [Lentzea tibetensis]TWP50527.1 FAD-binding protein [Lentzea tibetensis]